MANSPPTTQPAAPPGGGAPASYGSTTSSASSATTGGPPPVVTNAPALPAAIASKSFTVSSSPGNQTYSQTQQLLSLLNSLEKGQPLNNVDQATLVAVYQAAGIRAGQPLTQKRMESLKTATAKLITTNLQGLGFLGDEVKKAKTAAQFEQIKPPPGVLQGLKAQGYNTDNTNTVESLVTNLAKQQPTTTANGTLTGQDIYNQFQSEIATPAGAANMAALLNSASSTITPVTADEPQAMLAAFQNALSSAPAGTNPYTYLQGQSKAISAAGISPGQKPDSAYTYVKGLGETIWGAGVLSNDEINAISQEYPDAGSSTADDVAIRQAVAHAGAQTWQYDPNQIPAGGSYLASVVNQIQNTAGQYALPLTPQTLTGIVKDTLESGDLSSIYAATDAATASAELHAKDMTASLYPALAPMIKQGYTVQDIMSPYKQMAAATLGTSADSINLTDPQWAGLLESPEGKMPSVNQFQATVMQNPAFDWQNSADAETKYANMAQTLVSTWGKIGGGPQAYTAPSNGLTS